MYSFFRTIPRDARVIGRGGGEGAACWCGEGADAEDPPVAALSEPEEAADPVAVEGVLSGTGDHVGGGVADCGVCGNGVLCAGAEDPGAFPAGLQRPVRAAEGGDQPPDGVLTVHAGDDPGSEVDPDDPEGDSSRGSSSCSVRLSSSAMISCGLFELIPAPFCLKFSTGAEIRRAVSCRTSQIGLTEGLVVLAFSKVESSIETSPCARLCRNGSRSRISFRRSAPALGCMVLNGKTVS